MTKRRFGVRKLVRDESPTIMAAAGMNCGVIVLEDHEEYLKQLQRKLLEEANEVCQELHTSMFVEELADVYEVVVALAEAMGFDEDAIKACRDDKRRRKGGFARRLYSMFVEMDGDNPEIKYYEAKASEYPEEPVPENELKSGVFGDTIDEKKIT